MATARVEVSREDGGQVDTVTVLSAAAPVTAAAEEAAVSPAAAPDVAAAYGAVVTGWGDVSFEVL